MQQQKKQLSHADCRFRIIFSLCQHCVCLVVSPYLWKGRIYEADTVLMKR